MTTIVEISGLPCSPFNGTGIVGIIISNSTPSFFMVQGSELGRIVDVKWYPTHPTSVKFETRDLILVDDTLATFMVLIVDNYYDDCNRGGVISFRLDDETTITVPAVTFNPVVCKTPWVSPTTPAKIYDRVSVEPLWDDQGLTTG